jgi:CRP-like cAMP-binding protein
MAPVDQTSPPTPFAELLRSVPIFTGCDAPSLAVLAGHIRRRTFPAGEALFHEGDPGHSLYVVLTGCVNIQKVTADGTLLHLNECGRGEAFGEMALVDGHPRSADAVTAESTELLILDRDDFLPAVRSSPQIAFSVMACLAERVRAADRRFAKHTTLDVLGRIAAVVLSALDAGAEDDGKGGRRVRQRLSHQAVADQARTTRESVSRTLTRLRDLRVLRLDGRQIVVLDERKLRRYAGG